MQVECKAKLVWAMLRRSSYYVKDVTKRVNIPNLNPSKYE